MVYGTRSIIYSTTNKMCIRDRLWIVCASLSSTKEILTGRVMDFSNGLKWDNYVTAWNTQNVSLYFFNSLVYAIVSCVGVLLISAPGAYVLSRWKFVGGKAIRIGLVIAMSVPTIMIIMPLYSLAVQWGIKGRVLLVVLYIMLRVPYTTIYLLDFFSSLSRSYEEAAYIDGCSHSRTFWQIMLPLVQPDVYKRQPNIISAVALATMWIQYVFNYDYGLLNQIVKAFGGENVRWLGTDLIFWAMMIAFIFGSVGYYMLKMCIRDRHRPAQHNYQDSW